MKSDKELVKAFIGGDKKAFEELYNTYKDSLLRFLISYTRNRDMAEDIFQKSFVKFFEKARQLSDKKNLNFKSWIFKVAVNLCKDEWKSGHFTKNSHNEIEMENLPSYTNTEAEFVQKWESERLRNAMNHLSDKLRKTLSLYYYSDFSLKEISRFLHIPLGTVKSRINKGVKLLTAMLTEHYHEKKQ